MMRRVAVIGAGASGLCSARGCLDKGIVDVIVYEQSESIGGTWVLSDHDEGHSSMYENMRTNLPREVMAFPDFPFPKLDDSFVDSVHVLKYLESYATCNGLMKHIKFGHTVRRVQRDGDGQWILTVSTDKETITERFDLLFVCNGHYFAPKLIDIKGQFRGRLLHSHGYRSAESFRGQRVLVIGAGPSGCDIMLQLAETASFVYLCHAKSPITATMPDNVAQKGAVRSFDGHSVIVEDGERLDGIDSIVLCTGFVYSFPFFHDEDHIVHVKANGKWVSPLYQHMAHAEYSRSLFFIGLNFTVIPFILFYIQVQLALALVSGRLSVDWDMARQWESERLKELEVNNESEQMFHFLGPSQWNYFRHLARLSGVPVPFPPVIEAIFGDVDRARRNHLATYKQIRYEVVDQVNFIAHNQAFDGDEEEEEKKND